MWMASTMACLCRLQFFANCLAVGKARQSVNPVLPTAGNSSWQRDLFAECREKSWQRKLQSAKSQFPVVSTVRQKWIAQIEHRKAEDSS
jgi:hypothetical protein